MAGWVHFIDFRNQQTFNFFNQFIPLFLCWIAGLFAAGWRLNSLRHQSHILQTQQQINNRHPITPNNSFLVT